MVGPVTDEERFSFLQKVKAGFVVLVALSGGLITLQADAGLAVFAGATMAGGAVGAVLVRVAFPSGEDVDTGRGRHESREWGWDDEDERERTEDRERQRQRR